MLTLETIIKNLDEEFDLGPYQISELKNFIEGESIKPHVCEYALARMMRMQASGKPITAPRGLFISILKKHRDMPEPGNSPARPQPRNPLAGEGFDFWFGGDRSIRNDTCERIIWLFDSDDVADNTEAYRLLKTCAPALRDDELRPCLRVATDYEHKFNNYGTWPTRLANATRLVISKRTEREAM